MRTVNVAWDGALEQFTALGTHDGRDVVINAPHPPGSHHPPTGFSATELLLAGAGACSAWDVLEILRKRREQITSLEVTVEGHQQADPPWTYQRLVLHYRIGGSNLVPSVLTRVVRLSIVGYCSVLTTVRGVAQLEATLELVDAEGLSSGRLPVNLAVEPLDAAEEPAIGDLGADTPVTDED
jgi:putative redox protein